LPELIPISFGLREYMLEEEAQQQKIVLSRLSWTVRPIDLVFKIKDEDLKRSPLL
jgi:hypothetical protein